MIASVNPATGETVATFDALDAEELDGRLGRAAEAYATYRRTTFGERAGWLTRAAEILESERDALGRIMTLEMGKPIEAARQEAAKCAVACRYYVEHGERLLADETVELGGIRSFIRYQPIGPVLAVMPWNFPFWQVFRFLAPALMAGNVGLLKHSSNVPQCALAIEDIVRRAGFPADVFQTLLIGSEMVQRVIDDPRVKAATLTGSEPAGRQVAAQAGGQIKKTVLELGGSDPFVVMPSADLEAAVRTAVQARVINNGQSCIAAKRFIVDDTIAGEFETRFVAAMQRLVVGDPMVETTQVGPLATRAIRDELDGQVKRSVLAGARVLTGGHALDRLGNYYAPTLLVDAAEGSPARCEEFFGPVAVVLRAKSIDDAIRLANDTPFGLGASVWTTDAVEQERLIDEIEAGMVFVNGMVASDPRLPFGGVKSSGYGRELGVWGIREFVNVKSVVVR
uniref:Aldehyde dehydrogenase n=1 Tax=Solibacter usitatus (strain Ellin6076) TaxID=234267 RepID=Q01SB0_SOLUE